MDYEEAPKEVKEFLDGLKHCYMSIETMTIQGFEEGEDIKEAADNIIDFMTEIKDEAEFIIQFFERYEEEDKEE